MVGTGIFLTAAPVANACPTAAWVPCVWALGGVFALAGALCFAELGTLFPRAGGHYVYLREAYGPGLAFLDGWLSFLVSFPCSIAFMSLSLVQYLQGVFPHFPAARVLAAGNVALLHLSLTAGHLPAILAIAGAVFVLRLRQPALPRPFRVPLFPFTPALFCLASVAIAINAVVSDGRQAALAAVTMLAGGGVFLVWRRFRPAAAGAPPSWGHPQ
jgi:amino acid transporter